MQRRTSCNRGTLAIGPLTAGLTVREPKTPARVRRPLNVSTCLSGKTSFRDSQAVQRRWKRGMRKCEEVLAKDPKNAEALVWHGSGPQLLCQKGVHGG